ncbi:MAG: family 1 glycosylhydrolase, partial [Acidimicrobiales bacterium]
RRGRLLQRTGPGNGEGGSDPPAGAGGRTVWRVSHFGMTVAPGRARPLRLGVAVGGFEEEGGYNRPGLPANSWSWWEAEGRAPASRGLNPSWPRWESELAAAAARGCRTARVSVEWARCEPLDGSLDRRAFGDYCRLLESCHDHGLQPVVTLHRLAHPAWLGADFWLRPDSPERFGRWVEAAVDRFAGRTHQWVTIDRLNVTALWSYLGGHLPPGRRLDVAATIRCLDHLLAAHVLAFEAVKERQPQAVVGFGTRVLPVYELDRLLVDLLLGPSHGVGRHEVGAWLAERRDRFGTGDGEARTALTWALRQWASSAVPLEQALARTTAAVYESACARAVDVLHLGAEDGDLALALPFPTPAGAPDRRAGRLARACRSMAGLGLPVAVVSDGPTDEHRLAEDVEVLEEAVAGGAPVVAYYSRPAAPARSRRPGSGRMAGQRRSLSLPG